MSDLIIKKKRGRKPKNYHTLPSKAEIIINPDQDENSEEEKVIFHIPIPIDEITQELANGANLTNESHQQSKTLFVNSELVKSPINSDIEEDKPNNLDQLDMSIFITDNPSQSFVDDSEATDYPCVNTQSHVSPSQLTRPMVNKIITHTLKFTSKTKCWWCKNHFNTPPVQLPDDYYSKTFFCHGHFCSFNCMKSYNLDLNDSLLWKRESLINLLYFMTYSEYKEITPAPHWITLEEYGGTLTLDEFRKNSLINSKEYLVLHPPLISRQMQIEESYKISKLKEVPIGQINRIYSEMDSEYSIKRKKPIQSKQLNLETTMGLIKKKSIK
jgi:hypothetical protein